MSEREPLGDALELGAIRVGFVLHAAVAVLLCFVPLFDVLGFERALVTGLLAAPVSAAVGISMVKSARARGGDDLARIASHAIGISLLMLIPTLALGVIVELVHRPCDQQQGILFLILLAGGNATFSAALGVVTGTLTTRRFVPGLVVAAALVAFLFYALYRLYAEPQIFIFSLPFGYWPGSLYDEDLEVSGALWIFRGYTVLVMLALVSVARMFADRKSLVVTPLRPRVTALIGSLILSFAAITVGRSGESLGISLTRETIERELSRHIQTQHFDLYIAPTISTEQAELLKEDHELRFRQLARFFERAPARRIKSFVYASERQKQRLMGAAATQISRPWANEIHINGFNVPHPVLKHELAHVFAGELAKGPFKVPASFVVFVNIGVVEGIAVAADWPANELTVEGWSRAMRALGMAPDLTRSLDPIGFWGIASARAYTIAGAFVRYLIERYGMPRFAKLYASNSFVEAYERPLKDLVKEWEAHIDQLELPARELSIAEHRFKRPGIFQKVCAHKAANLAREGYQRLSSGDIEGAIARLEELVSYSPINVQPLLDISAELSRHGLSEEARRYAKRALATPQITKKSAAEAEELIAGIDWRSGEVERARRGYEEVLALHIASSVDRLQIARLSALDPDRPGTEVLRPLLLGELDGPKALVKLGALTRAHPDDALARYLYGRQLETAGAYEEGIVELRAALELGLPSEKLIPEPGPLSDEAEVTLGRLLLRAGRYAEASSQFAGFAARARSEALKLTAADWAERATFAETFHRPRRAPSASGQ